MSSFRRVFFPALFILCVSFACNNDPPTAPRPSGDPQDADGSDLYAWGLAPIAGLTSEWHPTPAVVVVPVGTTVRFRCAAPGDAVVEWSGANEVSRDDNASIAECPVHEAGRVQVHVETPDGETGRGDKRGRDVRSSIVPRSCVIVGVDLGGRTVRVASARASVRPLDLGEQPTNEMTMHAFFGGGKRFQSVSSLRKVGENRYRTAIGRQVRFEAVADPPEFTPMMEWRLPGERSRLGVVIERISHAPGVETIDVGPPARTQAIQLETYSVQIRLAESIDGQIQDGEPAVFIAETTPPGFESDVTWLSSTRSGNAIPTTGRGRAFTAVFSSTLGPHPDGGEWRWLGVRADNAIYELDEKFSASPYETWSITGIDPGSLSLYTISPPETAVPYSQQWPGDQQFITGPYTYATCVLYYTGTDHQLHEASSQIVIDNVSHQILRNGQLVTTLAQMFNPLPFTPLGGTVAWVVMQCSRPSYFDVFIVPEIVLGPKWRLDNKKFIPGESLTTDFDRDRGDLTPAEETAALTELQTVYGLPNPGGLVKKGPPSDAFNCHGYTFLKSERWMNAGNTGQLIKDIVGPGNPNGYSEVGGSTGVKAKVGDVVVYEKNGNVTHTGKVTEVDANGNPTKVEGKWGNLGTYEHAPNNVPTHFGTPKYYHTDRAGGNCLTKVAC